MSPGMKLHELSGALKVKTTKPSEATRPIDRGAT
jgi:hypothetical protein